MSAQTALDYRTNRDLFSNYHLDEHLPETEAWNEIDEEELQAAYDDIKELWDEQKDTVERRNESQLEEKFIRPMFRKLGIPFEVEESANETQRRPDYGFFETKADATDAFQRREEGGDFYQNAVAVADAKRWGRKLDTRGKKKRDYENPSHQIDQYLRFTSMTWGVLTNGQKWRLYYKPTSHKLDSYYEIDLPTVLETGNLEEFKYFYLFFRHEAFVPDASGDAFLDDVYEESNLFAQDLGQDLQDNIYDAIVELSEGFLQYPENDLDENKLDLIHDSSLIYLYRIIFVLYAEAEGRDLLDTNNEIYESQYSLNQLKQEVAKELESGDPKYRDWQDNLHSQLDELFTLIDQGSRSRGIPEGDLYIPAYNGGLFRTNPDESGSREARFLANNVVGDEHLAQVIELLTRSESSNGAGKIFVDYSSLDVRHLGSIYEGLLEYDLNVADEPLSLDDGEYVVADEDSEVIVKRSDVYLTTGSGERKATGSYYTPEYVVEYIVDETLRGPVDEIRKDVVMDEEYQDGGYADEFANRVFDLKILDPAMGSGHFLSSVVDYLARAIITEQNREANEKGGDVINDEHDINWARRKVAQRCIYGVDINPLATELAKVSLWLRTLAAEQPLAFLDHHLKTGNSLVGSDIQDVLVDDDKSKTDEGQLTLEQSFAHTRKQALDHVMDRFSELLAIDNETLEDAKEMEDVYQSVQSDPLYQKLLAMANVHTAGQFGLDIPSDADKRMAEALRADSWENIEGQDWFKSAQTMADDELFFHWELEFPVAFYDVDGNRIENAGFDAIVGNPPYVRQEMIGKYKSYFETIYSTYHSTADLYTYFFEKETQILSEHGTLGIIVTNRFITTEYGEPLREFLSDKYRMKSIIDFGDLPVFEGISTYPAIFILQKGISDIKTQYCEPDDLQITDLNVLMDEESIVLPSDHLDGSSWTFQNPKENRVVKKIESVGTPLNEIINSPIRRGIMTGYNDALIIDRELRDSLINKNPNLRPLIQKFLSGENVLRYTSEFSDEYLLWLHDDIDIDNFPALRSYLLEYKSKLEERTERGKQWYQLRPCDYYAEFEEDKIVFPEVSKRTRFTLDNDGYFLNKTVFFFVEDDWYFVAKLNSKLAEFFLHNISSMMRGGYYMNSATYVNQTPLIPTKSVSRDTADTLRDHAKEISKSKNSRQKLNTCLIDHLGTYETNSTLGEVSLIQPPKQTDESIMAATSADRENLRVGSARVNRESPNTVMIKATARYKPEDKDAYETDQWGYTETKYLPVFKIIDLTEQEADLIEHFVPVAVNEASGFANFRETATKTNSLIDRLKAIELPDIDDVADDLENYLQTKERAEELDEKIEKTDQLIDEIVYDLYELTDEEIEIVESAVADD